MNEEILQYFQMLMQYAAENAASLSPESQQALAQMISQFIEIIEMLTNPGVPQETEQPPIEEAMPSSNVEGFAYDPKTNRLYVRFLGRYPERNGPVYQYENVPANIFDIFRKGAIPAKTNGRNRWGRWFRGKYPSIGAAMYHVIRAGGYPFQQIA